MSRLAVLALATGCNSYAVFDAGQPIDVVPVGGWTDRQVEDLTSAAACWGLEFGVEFRVTATATEAQRVTAEFTDFLCLGNASGRYLAGFEGQIQLCPDKFTSSPDSLFWVAMHELGHAAGIRVEGSGRDSIMGLKPALPEFGREVFSDEDRQLFAEAQPELTPSGCTPRATVDARATYPRGVYGVGTGPFNLVLDDLDRDGRVDLVVANGGDATISVLLNTGNTFAQPAVYATENAPHALAIGDVNGDGGPDLIAANTASSSVSVLLARGDGTFAPQAPFATGGIPGSVSIVDMNADARPDLIVGNHDSISVLLGNGDGTFAPFVQSPTGSSASVAIGDLDGDGQSDAIVARASGASLGVLLRRGDAFDAPVSYAIGATASRLELVDLDGNGSLDVVTGQLGVSENSVSVLLNNGDGTFGAASTPASFLGLATVADLDGDSRPDLVLISNASVSVLRNNGNGTFAQPAAYPLGSFVESVTAADVDGDRDLDLIMHGQGDRITVLFNTAASFSAQVSFLTAVDALQARDLDGDGALDLVSVVGVPGRGGDLSVLLGHRDGTFTILGRPVVRYVQQCTCP